MASSLSLFLFVLTGQEYILSLKILTNLLLSFVPFLTFNKVLFTELYFHSLFSGKQHSTEDTTSEISGKYYNVSQPKKKKNKVEFIFRWQ